jgi:pyruvate dehydrogenase E1 component alpha subunit
MDLLVEDYRRMLAIRRFEERAQEWFHASKIRGSIHLGIGQEAVAVGARRAMRDGDIVACLLYTSPSPRDRG